MATIHGSTAGHALRWLLVPLLLLLCQPATWSAETEDQQSRLPAPYYWLQLARSAYHADEIERAGQYYELIHRLNNSTNRGMSDTWYLAMREWASIAREHAVVADRLRQFRDYYEESARTGELRARRTRALLYFNEQLGEGDRSYELFLECVEREDASAIALNIMYRHFRARLLEAGEFDICQRFMQPPAVEIHRCLNSYMRLLDMSDDDDERNDEDDEARQAEHARLEIERTILLLAGTGNEAALEQLRTVAAALDGDTGLLEFVDEAIERIAK